ncbi:hypothetical protein D3C87_1447680 [compost metagenome]
MVTSFTSIQNPLTATLCAGISLGCASLWLLPIRNSRPGTHAMPGGPFLPSPNTTLTACGLPSSAITRKAVLAATPSTTPPNSSAPTRRDLFFTCFVAISSHPKSKKFIGPPGRGRFDQCGSGIPTWRCIGSTTATLRAAYPDFRKITRNKMPFAIFSQSFASPKPGVIRGIRKSARH